MPMLLIAWHSRTGASAALAQAARDGALGCAALTVQCIKAGNVDCAMALAADGYLFVGPENLGALSGEMKELLDRTYYPLLGRIEGRPYAHIIAAGSDGEGAAGQLRRIVTGWRLQAVADPLIVNLSAQTAESILAPKSVPSPALDAARDIGALMANGIAMGIF